MRRWFGFALILLAVGLVGCGKGRDESKDKVHDIKGTITAVDLEKKKVTLDHEDIPGVMGAMVMPFDVESAKVLEGLKTGDKVRGKLKVVGDGKYVITSLEKMGGSSSLKLDPTVVLCCHEGGADAAIADGDAVGGKKGIEYEYFCPMHPFIVRDDLRHDKCPICFMPFSKQRRFDKLTGEERVQHLKAEMAQARSVIVPLIRANLAKLKAEDRLLAEAQEWCPVLECNPLGLMGTPVKTVIKGHAVFLCCGKCEDEAKKNPDRILAKVERLKSLAKSEHPVRGKIVQITVTIEHEDIPGVLKAQRMDFNVEGVKGLEGIRVDDVVEGKVLLKDGDFKLSELKKR